MVQHTLGTVDACQSFSLIMLGLTQDFKEGGLQYSPSKAVTCKGGPRAFSPVKSSKLKSSEMEFPAF